MQVARYCSESGRRLVFSLSGTYVCERHTNTICQLLPHVSLLFGHSTEFSMLARQLGLEVRLEAPAARLAEPSGMSELSDRRRR